MLHQTLWLIRSCASRAVKDVYAPVPRHQNQRIEAIVTYLQFLGLFTLAPIALLLVLLRGRVARATWRIAALLALLAFIYTAPWDNLIVVNRVWSYSRRQVLGLVIGVIPLEEYLFYALQVIATVLFCAWLRRSRKSKVESRK
jgi:lycopene cyclase domain-containing protein